MVRCIFLVLFFIILHLIWHTDNADTVCMFSLSYCMYQTPMVLALPHAALYRAYYDGAGVNDEFSAYLTAPRLHNQDLADYLSADAQRYLHHHGQERENSMAMSEDGRRDTSTTILSGDGTDMDGVQVVAAVGPVENPP